MPRLLNRLGGLVAALALSIYGLCPGAVAHAQSLTLDRYSAAETVRDGFTVSRPDDRGNGRFGFDLHLDYSNDPLVLEQRQGDADTETARVVSDLLVAHVGFWVSAADRLVIFAGLDVNLLMEGESFRDPVDRNTVSLADGTRLGDARLGARLRLLGENDDPFAVAAQLTATFPTAKAADDGQSFAGEDSLTLLPELLMEARAGGVRITVNGGILVRKDQDIGGSLLGEELRLALGLTVPIAKDRFDLIAELFGGTMLEDPGQREATPIEFLVGGKLWFSRVCAGGLAGGAGLQRGLGSPDFRIVLSLGCDLPSEDEEPEPVAPDPDTDGDGLLDRNDQCVTEPEDRDHFEDENGCPDPDNDQDGVLDAVDACPLEPEDKDNFEDENGCPDPDNDQDGVLDTVDACPLEPEDKDNFEDGDGCPDPDNDKDGVLDGDDRCPLVPGVAEQQGCSKVRIEDGRIVILDRVEFATNKAVILSSSEALLDEVHSTIVANPQLKIIRIEGHTDSRGRDKSNMDLSKRRASSVARWLSDHGVAAERLQAYGCGENLPLDDNKTDAGRQANRRVEFHIVDPAPTAGPRAIAGCQPNAF